MKPVDVKSSAYINSGKKNINKDPKFKTGDFVSMSKYKNIFVKSYVPNRPEEVFTKVKKYCIVDICY